MKDPSIKKILIVRPDAIGDVTLMIPLINSIKATYPDADIYTLQQAYTQALLDQHHHVKAVLIDKKKSGEAKGFFGFFRYAAWIKSYQFDVVIFSYLDAYYAGLALVAGIPMRIGDAQKIGIRPYLTHPIAQRFRDLPLHEVEQNLRLMHALPRTPVLSYKMDIVVDKAALVRAKKILKDNGWTGGDLIGVHPTTGGGNRAWTAKGYAAFIHQITQNSDQQVLLSGFGKKDAEIVHNIETLSKTKCVNIVNKTTLQELISAITLLKMMVGTDTGPTHIAAALNVPVLCVSPTKFVKSLRWGPWGTPNRIVGFPERCDFVCNPHTCTKNDCLDAISAKEVYDEAQYLLSVKEHSDPKIHWFKKSCTVMVYVSDVKQVKTANSLIERLKKEGIRFSVFATTQKISTRLDQIDILLSAFSPSFFKEVIVRDINIIHHIGKRSIWLRILRQLVAPYIYCPPIIVYDVPDSSQLLSTYYMAGFKK
jgi:ADP-heptose:LPS heptosyltransferase